MEETETVPKKTAALEVYSHVKTLKITSIVSISAYFIIMVSNIFSYWLSVVVVLGFVAFSMFYLYKANNYLKYLEEKYQIGK